jgi:7-carboxy-7-deazaguanine synthase
LSYAVKEIFKTLQGEGAQTGRTAVFCRFAGCNLWSGREEDRHRAVCQFCDTDFVGTDGTLGGKYPTATDLVDVIERVWAGAPTERFVVCTGGEPLLQVDNDLVGALHDRGFEIAVETNGTVACPPGVDWICVSPKAGAALVQTRGSELKLVFPQAGMDLKQLEALDFRHRWLQPMDGSDRDLHTTAAIAYCLENPVWRLSIQTHKLIGIR